MVGRGGVEERGEGGGCYMPASFKNKFGNNKW